MIISLIPTLRQMEVDVYEFKVCVFNYRVPSVWVLHSETLTLKKQKWLRFKPGVQGELRLRPLVFHDKLSSAV